MQWRDVPTSVDIPRLDGPQLWLLAVISFGFGDVMTTIIGLRIGGVHELHPISAYLFQYSPLGVILVLKTIVFGIGYLLWAWTPRPACLGVPLGLVTVGVPVTVWNLYILLRAFVL